MSRKKERKKQNEKEDVEDRYILGLYEIQGSVCCLLGLQHGGQFCSPRGQREGQSYLGLMRSRVPSASDAYRKRSEGRKGIRKLREKRREKEQERRCKISSQERFRKTSKKEESR